MSGSTGAPFEHADRPATATGLRALVGRRLGIDPRALAAFRIALGLLVLADLAVYRVRGLHTFYTDGGVFPRSVHAELFPTLASVSLHALSGSAWVQGGLFALAAVVACCLLVGYRTRLATAASVALLASLHARNPYVLNGGDTILLSFLFLGLFLPLGARWSVDAARRRRPRRETSSTVGGAVALLYFVLIYATNAVFKFQSEPWMDGTAVPQIFHLEAHIVLLGPLLADVPALLVVVNWLWIALLAASPLLVVLTGRLRIALAAAFVAAHLGMAVTMRLGLFPFVMTAGLLLFLPPRVWNRIETVALERAPASLAGRLSDPSALPGAATSVALPPGVRRLGRRLGSVAAVCFLVAVLLWQGAVIGVVDAPDSLEVAPDEYGWAMFAPSPPDTNRWYVAEATGPAGSTDVLRGDAVDWEPPPDAAEAYPTVLWHRYLTEMRSASETRYEPLAAHLCADASDDVETLTVYYVEQPVGPDGPRGEPVAHERIDHQCAGA